MLLLSSLCSLGESITTSMITPTKSELSLTNTMVNWTELPKILASDGEAGDYFGYSIAVSDDTALIGSERDDDKGVDSGSVYVFNRMNNTWIYQMKLIASDGRPGDLFGSSVSISGDTALIGTDGDDDNGIESGSAYVFIRTGAIWVQQAKLLASDGAADDLFGWSVSLYQDTALIGALNDDDNGYESGSAYVFTRVGMNWIQQAKLLATDGTVNDFFGGSVSLSNNTALIGAHGDDDKGAESGSAYVFTRAGVNWTQQAKLLASDETAGDYFGWSVSLSDDTALIGADGNDDNGAESGSAYVFIRVGVNWIQQAKLLALDSVARDYFGWSVSLSSDVALIGAPFDDDHGEESGSAYVFNRTGSTWVQQAKLNPSDSSAADRFGWRLCLSNDTAMFGVRWDMDNGVDSGSAYVFIKENKNAPPIIGTPTPLNNSINNPHHFTWSIPIIDLEGDVFSWTIQCSSGHSNTTTDASNGTKSLTLSGLMYSTTFKIWVNATDPFGSNMFTRKWYTFTTKTNQPPDLPLITGPSEGIVGVTVLYNLSTIDPDGDAVYYFIDWGDNTNSSWIGPYVSGNKRVIFHTWSIEQTYTVRVKAKDIYGNESDWAQLAVTIPKGLIQISPLFIELFERFLQRFPLVFPLLRQLFDF